jgi:hypothetical protein
MTATLNLYNDICEDNKSNNRLYNNVFENSDLEIITEEDICNLHTIFSGRDLFPSLQHYNHITAGVANDYSIMMKTLLKLKNRILYDKNTKVFCICLGNDNNETISVSKKNRLFLYQRKIGGTI